MRHYLWKAYVWVNEKLGFDSMHRASFDLTYGWDVPRRPYRQWRAVLDERYSRAFPDRRLSGYKQRERRQ